MSETNYEFLLNSPSKAFSDSWVVLLLREISLKLNKKYLFTAVFLAVLAIATATQTQETHHTHPKK